MKLKKFKNIDIIIDNENSWMWDYIVMLENVLVPFSQNVRLFKNSVDIMHGDVLFILSCDKILNLKDLDKHKHNIVIHASDLPSGKGWSPWSWEVESGANKLTLTLFEAKLELDSGDWYLKDNINLDGTELIDDIRKLLALKEFDMIGEFLTQYPIQPKNQTGQESFYQKRTINNQEININKSILEQFNLLRVCDNDNYPAYFYIKIDGKIQKYIINIFKE